MKEGGKEKGKKGEKVRGNEGCRKGRIAIREERKQERGYSKAVECLFISVKRLNY